MNRFFKEAVLWILIALPYVYLASIWSSLPERVPIHFGIDGEPDDWSGKNTLLVLPGALTIGIYFLMLLIPLIDPKKKIKQMGKKYYSLRLILLFFFSVLSTYFLYITRVGNLKTPNMLIAILGVLFAVLGNYFQTVRPNYFIGIRTPWTLESEEVWKKTHRLAGRLWMAGGLIIAALSFFIYNNHLLEIMFGCMIAIMVIVPLVFSYLEFKKEKAL